MTISELFKSWIDTINTEFPITSIENVGDGTAIIYTCNTAWALKYRNITINDVVYEVTDVERGVSITVKGEPTGNTYLLDIPFYTYGSPKQVDIEREKKRKGSTIVTPMIYLFSPISEDINHDITLPIDKTINFTFSVLNDYSKEQFTEDIVDYSIKAMRYLTDAIVSKIQTKIQEIEPYKTKQNLKEYPKYGLFFDKSGAKKNIFSENLSGVENNLTITLKITNKCLNLCNS